MGNDKGDAPGFHMLPRCGKTFRICHSCLRTSLTTGLQEFGKGQFQRFISRDLTKCRTDGFTGVLDGSIVRGQFRSEERRVGKECA